MKLVFFGLTVSSSWGNGHATLWRGLIDALTRQGHEVAFFERDVPYYADTRDLFRLGEGAELLLYREWEDVRDRARTEVSMADVAMVTSYCPDALVATDLICQQAPALKVFYDMDTPVTLAKVLAGAPVPYVPRHGLGDFDLALSFTGGKALHALKELLGARQTAALYGHVDPTRHRPAEPAEAFRGDLSYIGTFAADRQPTLEALFVEPARVRPECRFVLAGSGYPEDFPWTDNIFFVSHLPPPDHPTFFCSSKLTLNVTRADMAAMGHCPSGRLFEAAACGVPVLSDAWEGLDSFFSPGAEVLVAAQTSDSLEALQLPPGELAEVGRRARARVLEEHTSERRAQELVALLESAGPSGPMMRPSNTLVGERSCGA